MRKKGIILPLYKGCRDDFNSSEGISLLCFPESIYEKILDELVYESYGMAVTAEGFEVVRRVKRGTLEMVYTHDENE